MICFLGNNSSSFEYKYEFFLVNNIINRIDDKGMDGHLISRQGPSQHEHSAISSGDAPVCGHLGFMNSPVSRIAKLK